MEHRALVTNINQSTCVEDYSFGPKTSINCRNGLDLTLTFEESFLGLLPALALIIASTVRLILLRNARKVVLGNSFGDTKAVGAPGNHKSGTDIYPGTRLLSRCATFFSSVVVEPSSPD
jgi:hypothetical protein